MNMFHTYQLIHKYINIHKCIIDKTARQTLYKHVSIYMEMCNSDFIFYYILEVISISIKLPTKYKMKTITSIHMGNDLTLALVDNYR